MSKATNEVLERRGGIIALKQIVRLMLFFFSFSHFNGIYELQIHSLQYRIQHESISLSDEKRILKEIKHFEGTREKVIANVAMRSKIQDSLGQKEDIDDQVKSTIVLMGVDLNGVRKEQHANSHFYQSRTTVHNAKLLAAQKDIKALEELSIVEVEKFMALWNGNKAFRDDFEKRILPSLDSRLLSRDGRIRNPDEKPLVAPEKPVDSETETILRPSVRQPKEEAKSDISVVAEEILVSGKLQKNKEVDVAKVKELKREEEIAKAKQAMERKKKLAEKEAAKAARRAQMEAEKKLKKSFASLSGFTLSEREKRAKKKVAGSTNAVNPEELIEAQDSEPEKVDVNTDAPVPATVSMKGKVPKENTSRYRNRTKELSPPKSHPET
ncbi:proton pump-interactor 1-like [Gossypium raimondii]|uniref:proton pump-interactor 1-like n=1 Tax=Gossypium raimondii TaxID=29730 RepID=UPI00227BA708|nr:proton pump-interactor 1-like [Gossypium raimondii]